MNLLKKKKKKKQDGQHQRVDIPAHARELLTMASGRKDRKSISTESFVTSPDDPIGRGTELNWNDLMTKVTSCGMKG